MSGKPYALRSSTPALRQRRRSGMGQRALLAFAVATTAGPVLGGGFALNEQNAKGLGTAFAGRGAMVEDASTVFTNPAGMSWLDAAQLSGGFAWVDGGSDISNAQGTFPGTNQGDPVPATAVPFAYYAQPIDDGWSAGIGVYTPFGLKTDYESSFQGRYFGTTSELTQITVQPTLSYRFHERLAVGLGVTYNWVEGELERNTPSPVGGPDIVSTVEGDDKASWGYNLGIMFEPRDGTRIGLSYRSEVDYELEGDTELSNVPATLNGAPVIVNGAPLLVSANFDAALDITLPDIVDLSVEQELRNGWKLHATAMHTGWSSFDELVIVNTGGPGAVETQDWDDTWTFALGTSWRMNSAWTLRAGIGTDETPTNDEHRSVRIPSGDRQLFSVGGTWAPVEHITADFGYTYIIEDEVPVSQTAPQGYAYRADFESTIHVLALQLNYRFE